jgi:hypothetical protein
VKVHRGPGPAAQRQEAADLSPPGCSSCIADPAKGFTGGQWEGGWRGLTGELLREGHKSTATSEDDQEQGTVEQGQGSLAGILVSGKDLKMRPKRAEDLGRAPVTQDSKCHPEFAVPQDPKKWQALPPPGPAWRALSP